MSRSKSIGWSVWEMRRVSETKTQIMNSRDSAEQAIKDIGFKDREHFIRYDFDSKNKLIGKEIVSIGTINASLVHPREVFKGALLNNAVSIVIAHNHPSTDTDPSMEDCKVQELLDRGCKLLGLDLLDFLIVGGKNWRSLEHDEEGTIE